MPRTSTGRPEKSPALATHVTDIVRMQVAAGIDVVNDGGFQSTAGNTEIPMTIAWAKLQALGEGARLASKRLWP